MKHTYDTVFVREIVLNLQIGCGEAERAIQQKIAFDVDIQLDTATAARSVELSDTICYVEVKQLITEISKSKPWVLLEQLGDSICQQILHTFPQAASVQLSIQKFIVEGTQAVGVRLHRSRENV